MAGIRNGLLSLIRGYVILVVQHMNIKVPTILHTSRHTLQVKNIARYGSKYFISSLQKLYTCVKYLSDTCAVVFSKTDPAPVAARQLVTYTPSRTTLVTARLAVSLMTLSLVGGVGFLGQLSSMVLSEQSMAHSPVTAEVSNGVAPRLGRDMYQNQLAVCMKAQQTQSLRNQLTI